MNRYFLFLIALTTSMPAYASVLSVSSPDVKEGEWSVETGIAWELDDNEDDFREYVLEFGYSPTDFWNTAFEFSTEDQEGDVQYAVTAWKNTLQFVKQNEDVPFSAGLRLQYEIAHLDDEADEITARLLMRHQNELLDTRFNIGVEREIGTYADNDVAGDIRASVRYKWTDDLRPAIDYLGDTGSLNNLESFESQDHRMGPVLYGNMGDLSYEVGFLAGLSEDAPDQSLKFALGWSF